EGYADYGDMTCEPVSNLRDLEEEFQRLPFMAIKGKLAGVVPLHTDWSVDDCVRFQNLVADKPLTSNVIYIEENFEDPMETVVSLHLRDIQNDKEEKTENAAEGYAAKKAGTKVAVRLCDYGDMTCEPVSNLRDLEEEFQRLPFMAIKGKLAGVVPLHTDWSVDDCVRFQNLVADKPLTSNVIYIEENFEDPMETVVSLHLRDIQNDKEEKTENAAEGYAAKKAGTKVAVRLCDYGDMTREPVSNLRDLEEEFQRLPFMAIKGKLAGVVPLHTDWSVDDCVRFQNLVADKPLTSNVIYIEENFEDPIETVVSLHLRDIQNDKEEKTENAAEGYAAKKAGTKVAVRLCDYGDMTCEPVSNLRDLEEEFQRLPFMAIKGKLAGVVPLHTDWSVDDCVRFQNLVADKPLTSNVIYIEENFEDPMETVVSLHLRDIQNDKEEKTENAAEGYAAKKAGTKVAVRLCDYGDMTREPVSNLRDLEEEFQRLPFMAIKGKLAGVVPLHTDWSVDDCVRFQNLVADKPLTSNVIYIEENFEDPIETVVSLHLRDIQNDKEEKTENVAESYAVKKALEEFQEEEKVKLDKKTISTDKNVIFNRNSIVPSIDRRYRLHWRAWIQILGIACERLGEVLNSLSEEEITKHKLTSYRQVHTNKIYLAKFNKDEGWYRAVVTAKPSMQQWSCPFLHGLVC
ncbi:Tudor domain-containing protein 7, partial [Homalodisca vitripennis]